jgi:deoxycytidine triphosphate deaminase
MSIKSDNWIRRMAQQQGLIEPFEPGQVREGTTGRVISYGTSSYGYDVRCAREFKIFTNINSTIVDPKQFDEKSFVDIAADVCIIPPNSFALARTVEYFRIPRNVLTVCLGKSTYARCFRGDTRVALVDGSTATLEDMARRHAAGESFRGYSLAKNGSVIVSLLEMPRFIGRDSLLEVSLDNGEAVHATPDHVFLRRDGRTAAASELRPGDSLMPLYRDLRHGDEYVYQPLNGHLLPTQGLAEEWHLRQAIDADALGSQPHHFGSNRADKRPANPSRVPARAQAQIARQMNIRADASATARNHKVIGLRDLPGQHDVYCLTVPEAGNFALQAGVFVQNCGIIVNVTPLEPEWEGHVTLEFSNTTPLPAKIYANEGVAQMLFFESDEVCATSYADRGGKYQRQQGVTLPKA